MIEMTLEMAEKAVKAAQAKAKDLGTPITVTVVDEAGRLVLCARGDGTGFLTPETSRGKAVASVALPPTDQGDGRPGARASGVLERPARTRAGQILPSTGGVPFKAGGRVIGAIGCGGGTGERITSAARWPAWPRLSGGLRQLRRESTVPRGA